MSFIETDDILSSAKHNKFGSGIGAAKLLMLVMRLKRINKIYSSISHKEGLEFIDSVFEELEIKYELSPEDLKKIPKEGPFITVSNHPFGGIDGLILIRILSDIRKDYKVFANFLLQKIEPLKDYVLPVNPFDDTSEKELCMDGIYAAMEQLNNNSPIGIFPSGEVSTFYQNSKGITDKQWGNAELKFIKKCEVPIIPVYFKGSNSIIFHLLGLIHPLLRKVKLPSEFLRKRNKSIQIRIGNPITVKEQEGFNDISRYGRYLRAKTYALGTPFEVKSFFKPLHKKLKKPEEIVSPVSSEIIEKEVEGAIDEHLLFKNNEYNVIFSPPDKIPNIITEIGRLREITFREIGEGTNMGIDVDEYDLYYNQLFIWDENEKKIVGAYRMGMGKEILEEYGLRGFYIQTLFKIKKGFVPILENSMELGRSFIIKEYQRKPTPLFLLWKGILYSLLKNPDYRYLVGPVSISNQFSTFSRSLIIEFVKNNYYNNDFAKFIRSRKKFVVKNQRVDTQILIEAASDINKMDDTIKDIEPEDFGMPVLLKKYIKLGGKIIGFNLDPKFNDALDGLIIVDIYDVPANTIAALSKEINDSSILERFSFDDDKPFSHRE